MVKPAKEKDVLVVNRPRRDVGAPVRFQQASETSHQEEGGGRGQLAEDQKRCCQ